METKINQTGIPGNLIDLRGIFMNDRFLANLQPTEAIGVIETAGERLLVVDDDPDTCRMLEKTLTRQGYAVLMAHGIEAMKEALSRQAVDLILLDHGLPECSGTEGLFELQQLMCNLPPVIMLTARESVQVAVEFLRAGGADFLLKPVEAKMLGVSIQKAIQEGRLRNQLEDERTARKAAEASERLKSDFLANISHELRTPLHGISGFADLALAAAKMKRLEIEKACGYFDSIARNARHLGGIINNILDLSKIEAGVEFNNPEPFSVYCLMRDLKRDFNDRAGGTDQLKLFMPPEDLVISLDRRMLTQVLLNLIDNACKYAEAAPKRLQVTYSPTHQRLTFMVADKGPGIEAKHHQKIFEKFVRLKTKGNQPGTGLGLSITQRMVRLLGGELKVRSHPGMGARFFFHLHPKGLDESLSHR